MEVLTSHCTVQPERAPGVVVGSPFFRIHLLPSPLERYAAPILSSEEIFQDLFQAILPSRSILKLVDNWDGEGSCGYTEDTWWRAINFLLAHAMWIWQHHHTVITAPRILPGPDGSIDIHWESPSRELLVNVPVDPEAPIAFYGDNKGEERIKGTFSNSAGSSQNHGLLRWLTTGK